MSFRIERAEADRGVGAVVREATGFVTVVGEPTAALDGRGATDATGREPIDDIGVYVTDPSSADPEEVAAVMDRDPGVVLLARSREGDEPGATAVAETIRDTGVEPRPLTAGTRFDAGGATYTVGAAPGDGGADPATPVLSIESDDGASSALVQVGEGLTAADQRAVRDAADEPFDHDAVVATAAGAFLEAEPRVFALAADVPVTPAESDRLHDVPVVCHPALHGDYAVEAHGENLREGAIAAVARNAAETTAGAVAAATPDGILGGLDADHDRDGPGGRRR